MTELLYNIHDIFAGTGRESCLQQHGCSAYRIPPYQRGYKWGSEDNEPVETLLRDLRQAWKGKAKEYLLQAITVKKVAGGSDGPVLEVIDGQQRLTTLFILIHSMTHRLTGSVRPNIAETRLRYSIRHEDQALDAMVADWIERAGAPAGKFDEFKKFHNVDQQARQDGYYLQCAVLRCLHALRSTSPDSGFQNDQDIAHFQDFVLFEVKLMVNAVEAHVSGEEIFGNLNANRVVLTETELIKGLLLTRAARESAAGRVRRYREVLEMRIQLGRKWDELSQWAGQPEIKSLYFPEFNNDGMRGLLELVARGMPKPFRQRDSADGKSLFDYFYRQRNFESVFRLLANIYAQLQDWHDQDTTYHLLGYCLVHQKNSGERMQFLAELLRHTTKSSLNKALRSKRRAILGLDIPSTKTNDLDLNKLGYGGNDRQMQAILLALSVFQIGNRARFNFFTYEAEAWSIEHIFPQSPLGKGATLNAAQRRALSQLIENKGEVLTQQTVQQIARLQNFESEADRAEIERLLRSEPILHRIGNLCLLTLRDNAALGCAMFDEKRRFIRDRIARGSFVPSHTYEVFSKMIVGGDDSLDVWSKRDIEEHQAEIGRRMADLIAEAA